MFKNEEFDTIDRFCSFCCSRCTADPDGYCPSDCEMLEKARKIPFDKIEKKYIKHKGDLTKLARYIKNYRL